MEVTVLVFVLALMLFIYLVMRMLTIKAPEQFDSIIDWVLVNLLPNFEGKYGNFFRCGFCVILMVFFIGLLILLINF